ncbi:MAG: carboxymuconolactone decarboxylase family protein [Candidatus Rokubacteria bacterium]|nr:carboxymuconolactone decarboxylase family protein [Candidatus Rokubacteria bacterium]
MDMELVERVKRERGQPTLKWHEVLAEYAPQTLAAWHDMTMKMYAHEELDRKATEFIIVAIDAVLAWPYIDIHIHKAFEAGATIQELVETVVTAGALMGPHALSFGLEHLDKVIRERADRGLPHPRKRSDA